LPIFYIFDRVIQSRVKARHPDMSKDVCRAIAWVVANAKTYCDKADVTGIYLAGHSAGGHLAALVGMNPQMLREQGVEPSILRGVVSCSGIFNLRDPFSLAWFRPKNLLFRYMYLSTAVGRRPSQWDDASPAFHLHPKCPPFLFVNAEDDLGLEADTRRIFGRIMGYWTSGRPRLDEFHIVKRTSHASIVSRFGRHDGSVLFTNWIWRLHDKHNHGTPETSEGGGVAHYVRPTKTVTDASSSCTPFCAPLPPAATTSSPKLAVSKKAKSQDCRSSAQVEDCQPLVCEHSSNTVKYCQ